MKADSAGRSVAVSLVELSLRAQYAFMRYNKVRSAVEFGGGLYWARSGTAGQGIWNASFFFMGGAGVDYSFTPKLIGEFRVGNRQQFVDQLACQRARGLALLFWGRRAGAVLRLLLGSGLTAARV